MTLKIYLIQLLKSISFNIDINNNVLYNYLKLLLNNYSDIHDYSFQNLKHA